MAVVTLPQVQQWLEATKLTINAFDVELELSAERTVFGALASQYVVTGWTSTGNTPSLVQEIIAMFTAAWTYRRQYSEDSDADSWYATWLEGKAQELLNGLVGGTLTLLDNAVGQPNDSSIPTYWPDDNSTAAAEIWQQDPIGAFRAFSMSDRF
jgi:hypothetical protein